jgi:pilus assembly protein CpaC
MIYCSNLSSPRLLLCVAALAAGLGTAYSPSASGQQPMVIPPGAAAPMNRPGEAVASDANPTSPYFHVTGNDDRLKMVVNTSRFLLLDKRIPQVQVNNPEILGVVPVSPNQVQISAKRTGVTQVNLWGEDKRIYTVTVIVMGDAAELSELLKSYFPRSTLSVVPINGASVMISGYVEKQDEVPRIVAIAAKYFPDVINNMTVSGTQTGIVRVKVYEVSRTKLRNLGFDWAQVSTGGGVVWSGVNGLLNSSASFGPPAGAPDNLLKFSVVGGGGSFYGVLNALREDGLAKLMSEPNVVAQSGRPAYVLVGGEYGYQTTSALTGTTVGFKEYGTRLDIVPIVLGNGRMHIDVRARVSQIDAANSVPGGPPSLRTRESETGVELRSGQTLAIAGLIEQRSEATNHGVPWISEVPYLGVPFRSVHALTNEVETLVMLTPEIVDGLEPGQVPTCLPGMTTAEPSDWELFFKGHLEVPNCCPTDGNCQNCNNGMGNQPAPGVEVTPYGRLNPQNRSMPNQVAANSTLPEPGFIGPIGYDVLK